MARFWRSMTAGHSHDYLNKLELAERLGITPRNVEEMMRRRKIPFIALRHSHGAVFWPAIEKALGRLEHKAIGQEAK